MGTRFDAPCSPNECALLQTSTERRDNCACLLRLLFCGTSNLQRDLPSVNDSCDARESRGPQGDCLERRMCRGQPHRADGEDVISTQKH